MIVLVGRSSGATAVTEMAARLSQLGVPVKLAIGLDPTSHEIATGNVDRYVNHYVAHGLGTNVDRGSQFSGKPENVDMENNRDIGHFNIDKDLALQERVIGDIRASLVLSELALRRRPRRLLGSRQKRKSRTVIARDQADEL